MESLADFLNSRIKAEIAAGKVRDKFYTPMNRLAEFKGVAIKQDPDEPTKVRVVPLWMYVEDELDLFEGAVN
jgi:hypothetical protein